MPGTNENAEGDGTPKPRIIGIGTSAGGLQALQSFFDLLPEHCIDSFVVIQHLSPNHKSHMVELLSKHANLPVHQAEDGTTVQSGCIYMIPPGQSMTIANQQLVLTPKDDSTLHLPIDIFFRSMAQEHGNDAIGIILTGTGSDGTQGANAIKAAGGTILVQDPKQAKFTGMPDNAINAGVVDFVLPIEKIPEQLHKLHAKSKLYISAEKQVQQILARVKELTTLDFSLYKKPTIIRRVLHRMGISGCKTPTAYMQRLYESPQEATKLSQELLIGVTQFFRDPEVWKALQDIALPELLKHKPQTLKCWVVGCSTGEEAYSLAILLQEATEQLDTPPEIKIFATDLNAKALEVGSAGIYPLEIQKDVLPQYLEKYFVRGSEHYRVTDATRRKIIFSQHNILEDAPFNKMDLVLCRNMLIYVQPVGQNEVLNKLHYALKTNAYLMLGNSETVSSHSHALKEIDHLRLYLNTKRAKLLPSTNLSLKHPYSYNAKRSAKQSQERKAFECLSQKIAEATSSVGVLIDETFEIQHASGQLSLYANFPKNGFTNNLLKMLPQQLASAVRRCIITCQQSQETETAAAMRTEECTLEVQRVPFETEDLYFVLFSPLLQRREDTEKTLRHEASDYRITELESELEESRQHLHETIERIELNNEEFQVTNEELLTMNEELQSTNEELQSVNEELHTINREYQEKLIELNQVHMELYNLMKSTHIGMLFLDRSQRIRRITPAIQKQFHLQEQDVGRPLAHFTNTFGNNAAIPKQVEQVLRTETPMHEEILTSDGVWYLQQIDPYYNSAHKVDGVVISFINIHQQKILSQEVQEQRDKLERSNKELEQFAYVTAHDLQEPLRTVNGISRLLAESYGDVLDERGQEFIEFIANGTQRMSDLIRGLLDYSLLGRDRIVSKVDCNALLLLVKHDLMHRIEESNATLVIGPLPHIQGCREELHMLFQNLISNGIKFQRKDTQPHIHISAERNDQMWTFSVRDNGIGIEPKRYQRIFGIFQRLHTQDEYEGLGIGLAHCQKIVELHGGKIWVDSEPGQGSTFFFTLPEADR